MNSRQWLSIIVGAMVLSQMAVAPAAAQSDESVWGSMGETVCNPADENVSTLDCFRAANSGILSIGARVQYKAAGASPLTDDEPQVQSYADALQETYNTNNQTLETYVNDRFDGNASEHNVITLEFKAGGDTATRHLVADADNSTFSNSSVVNTTDRAVDHTVTFHDFAASDAGDELQRFVDEYASEDKDIDAPLVNRLANRYGGDVDASEELQP